MTKFLFWVAVGAWVIPSLELRLRAYMSMGQQQQRRHNGSQVHS